VSTRDKILQTSLRLFNEEGESSISTNHIAASLGMSPGNLYYHFRNKEEIIWELFEQYRKKTLNVLMVPTERALNYADKLQYLEGLLQNMWEFRFLHRNLEHLILSNPKLGLTYREFALSIMQRGHVIYQHLRDSGLLNLSDSEMTALIINIWIILTNWVSFLSTTGLFSTEHGVTQEGITRGIYQLIQLEAPYLRGEAAANLAHLRSLYGENH
jgi:AcrR family transcriptional regulator